ncbi:SEC-C metal-binding domain-containing protein [Chromohalobacter israelensis]
MPSGSVSTLAGMPPCPCGSGLKAKRCCARG